MSKHAPFVIFVVLAAAFFAVPGVAAADEQPMTVTCSQDCTVDGAQWSQSNVDVTFSWPGEGTDAVATVSAPCNDGVLQTISTEADQTLHCDVTYVNGDTSSGVARVRIDKTPPVPAPTGSASALANPAGWYRTAFDVLWTWTDGPTGSGIDPANCAQDTPYSGAQTDALGATVTSGCRDLAGNVAPDAAFPVKFDNTPPQNVDGTADRAPDGRAGWYTHAVTYAFSGTDPSPGSGMGPCDTVTYTGPDTPAASVTGGCSDNAGNRTDASDVFQYDGTKPSVTGAAASRAPDHNGWYTHPVAFSFQGTDPTSGIASCSTHTYSGPDDGTAQLAGSCTDGAGNVGTKTISFKYDSSPPAKSKPFAVPGNRTIGVSWAPPSDAASFVLTRAPAGGPAVTIYRGSDHDYVDQGLRNGRKYTYAITSLDAAGNQSAPVAISAVPDGSTLRPFLDTEVSQPPTLSWAKARKAHYYNLQLYRGRTKVLSVWPTTSRVQLKSKWRFNHHKYSLKPGLYRWYVWPGIGSTAAHRYGTMVGSSTFRVVK